jgi:RNase P/RNase MRP subunit POP5
LSKVDMDRPRYIAFHIEAEAQLPRRAVVNALEAASRGATWKGPAPRLMRYAFPHGIVRVTHEDQGAACGLVAALARMDGRTVRVQTLGASGTILALTTRLGILAKRD